MAAIPILAALTASNTALNNRTVTYVMPVFQCATEQTERES